MGDRVAHARDALQHPHQVAILDRLVEILQHEIVRVRVRAGVLSRVLPPFGVVDVHLGQHVLHLDPRHVERTATGGVVVAGVGKPGTNPQQYLRNLPGPTRLVRKRPPLLDPTHDRPHQALDPSDGVGGEFGDSGGDRFGSFRVVVVIVVVVILGRRAEREQTRTLRSQRPLGSHRPPRSPNPLLLLLLLIRRGCSHDSLRLPQHPQEGVRVRVRVRILHVLGNILGNPSIAGQRTHQVSDRPGGHRRLQVRHIMSQHAQQIRR